MWRQAKAVCTLFKDHRESTLTLPKQFGSIYLYLLHSPCSPITLLSSFTTSMKQSHLYLQLLSHLQPISPLQLLSRLEQLQHTSSPCHRLSKSTNTMQLLLTFQAHITSVVLFLYMKLYCCFTRARVLYFRSNVLSSHRMHQSKRQIPQKRTLCLTFNILSYIFQLSSWMGSLKHCFARIMLTFINLLAFPFTILQMNILWVWMCHELSVWCLRKKYVCIIKVWIKWCCNYWV